MLLGADLFAGAFGFESRGANDTSKLRRLKDAEPERLVELTECRALLEVGVARMAAHADEGALDAIANTVDRLGAMARQPHAERGRFEIEIHRMIVRAAGTQSRRGCWNPSSTRPHWPPTCSGEGPRASRSTGSSRLLSVTMTRTRPQNAWRRTSVP
jgi:FCD domain